MDLERIHKTLVDHINEEAELSERVKDHIRDNINSFDRINEKLELILTQTTKHNTRLTTVEKFMWIVTGIGLVVLAIVVPLFLKGL